MFMLEVISVTVGLIVFGLIHVEVGDEPKAVLLHVVSVTLEASMATSVHPPDEACMSQYTGMMLPDTMM